MADETQTAQPTELQVIADFGLQLVNGSTVRADDQTQAAVSKLKGLLLQLRTGELIVGKPIGKPVETPPAKPAKGSKK